MLVTTKTAIRFVIGGSVVGNDKGWLVAVRIY